MSALAGKHIILGICGGIAAYKSVSLLRLFVKAGAEVQVVITPAGKQFITPVTLSSLSQKPVVSEFFTANTGEWHSHVDLGLWADCMVIAPATASTIGKMAHGIADNMLVTTYLSAKSKVFVAPAMDLDMMAHPSTTANIDLLRSYGNIIIEPESGELASGLVGKGRMEEPGNIFRAVEAYFAAEGDLKGKKVLVTAGPTYERIDPVRFIGNFSSGKMGYAIAEEFASRGAEVTLVSGPVSLTVKSPAVRLVKVESGRQMLQACEEAFPQSDISVMCAAVADYAPADVADRKIKRERDEVPVIKLVKNPDIAKTLGSEKRDGQILVGFALETDHEFENAVGKMQAKNLDMIVLNSLRDSGAGFGTDTNKVTVMTADGGRTEFGLKSKQAVAADVVDSITGLLKKQTVS
ncbi:bifunctional phosphopantothenoylcysteine decarboxylase/phosphopantothenate--cysteine ligase CoaBC [Duncaniella sp.]|uniref:bifunctional phosphopantothenoylcysteine decarboxylase/phosphopantothenate--cysteine ligase CoaBC n=1 Tax=Duncaniella sp. TaxID=2518496 RepID=UPI0023C4DD40|nr:bifunctional phosphopantothenoylcysteine decarboxylase/phosphopantothenate--cysteine ligase CoaBC [Duncaniella sp.]MDE5903962.1 bifunctional phosphopantothenoylcysteine decarboxylase/phosphopantothenate--cysteine ligase CoaBC [Duncaniella sp.]